MNCPGCCHMSLSVHPELEDAPRYCQLPLHVHTHINTHTSVRHCTLVCRDSACEHMKKLTLSCGFMSFTHTHPCVKAPRDLSPRRSSPDRVHVSPLTCRSSFNCCSLRIRLELHRQENPCQLFFQHQIGTLITFPH